VDGELVQLQEGRPDLSAMLRRHGLTGPQSIQRAGRLHPVTYVVFDLLSLRQDSLCGRPLSFRRQVLADLLAQYEHPQLAFSAGLTGSGRELFTAAVAQGQEGIMAKHLASRYLPGRRSSAWRKIKPTQVIPCAILGYRPGREGGVPQSARGGGAAGKPAVCGAAQQWFYRADESAAGALAGPALMRQARSGLFDTGPLGGP